jgi:endonuclease G
VALLLQGWPFQGWGAHAATTTCPEHFAVGQAPDLVNPRLAAGTRALCFQGFAVLHSALTRTALYSAEHLTAGRIETARGTPRTGEFHPEPALPPGERADLADYARSGFDRGHLAPSGDMPDPEAQQESFTLANMVPQAPKLNRGVWEGIESAVRTLAQRRGELYVVTGPIFKGGELSTIGHVVVPTYVFKAVLDPRSRSAAAYVAENTDEAAWTPISIAQLTRFTGINVFPALPPSARNAMLRLPEPTPHGYAGDRPYPKRRMP